MSEPGPGNPAGGLPVAPELQPALDVASVPQHVRTVGRRTLFLCGISVAIGIASGVVARILVWVIALFTNIAFFGRISVAHASPADNHLGPWVIGIPVIGGVLAGVMARWGSAAIRGHGIPEAMEQVLTNESRIPARLTILKPLSAAFTIGTGGPFGTEGPIIATGGALGSLAGQLMRTTASERKTLLSAGAAAGMAAIFGSPVSAVLLAIEFLLFELSPRSLIPVALASVSAMAVRIALIGSEPAFAMPAVPAPSATAVVLYVLLGAVVGLASVAVTRIVYAVEDAFEHLPIHWMWWPAVGAVAVGLVGWVAPRTLGVGYDNIEAALSGALMGKALLVLCLLKFVSWAISLGSGTSGGTLAPLLTIGGGLGSVLGTAVSLVWPQAGVDPRFGALVGMAAMFAGASHALLTSVVFALEATRSEFGFLPLLAGCTAAYLLSNLLMQHSIMTEKIARRGIRVASEYTADFFDQVLVRDCSSRNVVLISGDDRIAHVREWLEQDGEAGHHQGFPVVDGAHRLLGVITRRELLEPTTDAQLHVRDLIRRPPAVAFEDSSLREAADLMVRERVGRLVVVPRDNPRHVSGILTRSDVLSAHQTRLRQGQFLERTFRPGRPPKPRA